MDDRDFRDRLNPHLKQNTLPDGSAFSSVAEAVLNGLAEAGGETLASVMIRALKLGVWPERFRAQRGTLGEAGQIRLLSSCAAVIGAGGLGGGTCLALARAGVGRIVVCDGDRFDESNLNRQALCNLDRIGREKALCAAEELARINPAVRVDPFPFRAEASNLPEILAPAQVVLDCLDNMPSRYAVEEAARARGIPFVHCAVAGREGVLMTVFPEDPGLGGLYGPEPASKESSAESILGVPTVTPHVLAGFLAEEGLNVLLGRPLLARNRLLHFDLSIPEVEANELA